MNQFSDANVIITLDGLMLLAFEKGNSKYERAEFGIVQGAENDTHTFRINVLEINDDGFFLHPEIKTGKNVKIYLKNKDSEVVPYVPGEISRSQNPDTNDPQDLRWCLDLESDIHRHPVASRNKDGFPAQVLTIRQGTFYSHKLKEVLLSSSVSNNSVKTKVACPIGCAITLQPEDFKTLVIQVEGKSDSQLNLMGDKIKKLYIQVTNYDDSLPLSDPLSGNEGDVRLYYKYCLETDLQYSVKDPSMIKTNPSRICNPGWLSTRTNGIRSNS